ncbi:hypothetical protein [Leptolyngbya sp. FACHB-261]|uniref:hypothetical protein n=1 Tax=Leptolyngbya sp. FACHB-261 TaxID=2692806 RepID=UPI001682402F|nr:hypothetical protein [Leptolyngbya sp. FACHB-261]MBD2102105.1 hypothetical protein [Leptolyngbya sp. FACHB-261]
MDVNQERKDRLAIAQEWNLNAYQALVLEGETLRDRVRHWGIAWNIPFPELLVPWELIQKRNL